MCHKHPWPSCIWYQFVLLPIRRILSARYVHIYGDTSLNEFADRFPQVREVYVSENTVLFIDASRSLPLMPTVDTVILGQHQIQGSEHLLSMLPNLRVVQGSLIELFVAVTRHPNIGIMFNGVERLEISVLHKKAHSIKQWRLVPSAFSQLRSLCICIADSVCPSFEVADFLVEYVERSLHLISFSFYIDTEPDNKDKVEFVSRLRQGLERLDPPIHICRPSNTTLETWK
jgi:hypothetical protein